MLADAGYKALILVNLFLMTGNTKFRAGKIKDCGEDRNVFSFTNIADAGADGSDWNIESFKVLKRTIDHYKENDKS